MLERAAREHGLDLRRSFVVGDRYGDIELAHRVGSRAILVRTGYGEGEIQWHSAKGPAPPDFIAENLADAADWILRQPKLLLHSRKRQRPPWTCLALRAQ